jgi:hypothetical protein
MTDYIGITESQSNPFAPLTSELVKQLRDNPIAIAEGAPGAPRLLDAALGSSPTNAGRNWVLERSALSTVGRVGTYAMLKNASAIGGNPGDVFSGSDLNYASAGGTVFGDRPNGSWRLMGAVGAGGGANGEDVSLFLRIS